MSRILFSSIVSNDLGPSTRLIPIAEQLSALGHEVAFCNKAAAPALMIEKAGYQNLTVKDSPDPTVWPESFTSEVWSGTHFSSYMGYLDVDYVRSRCSAFIEMMSDFRPDVVVDTWNHIACLAAKALAIPLVTLNQADLHHEGKGLIWWKEPPDGLPDPTPAFNTVLKEHGLPPLERQVEELTIGDLTLIIGTPETDPLPNPSTRTYIGPLLFGDQEALLPEWVDELGRDRPLIWIYPGNPRYGSKPSIADSIVVIRAGVRTFADQDVDVVLTTGHQPLPDEFKPLPANFRFEAFLPGLELARRCDMVIHHGGHGTYITVLAAGIPSLIVPTYSERESNARRLKLMGAGDYVLPTEDETGEKHVSHSEFAAAAWRVLKGKEYRAGAEKIARSMARYGGAKQAAELIDGLLRERH